MTLADIKKELVAVIKAKFDAGTLKANTNTLMAVLNTILDGLHLSSPLLGMYTIKARGLTPAADDLKLWQTIIYIGLVETSRAGKETEACAAYTAIFV